MSQKRHMVDQIIAKLCRADMLLGKGTKVSELCKQLEVATGIFGEKNSWDGIYKVGGCQWGKGAPWAPRSDHPPCVDEQQYLCHHPASLHQ